MDSLATDQFLNQLLKELKNKGFVEALGNGIDYVIKKGFETLAEAAVEILKNIIRRGFSYFQISSNNNHNPIFYIIFGLILKLYLPNFIAIILHIKAAIQLLNEILGKHCVEENKRRENKPNKKMAVLPLKLISKY